MEEILLYFALKYHGDFDNIYKALQCKERVDNDLKDELFKSLKSKYTTIISDDYPNSLKEISCPPFVLFYFGDLSLVNGKCMAVIGSRNPDDYGIRVTKQFSEGLIKNNYTIVSGLAKGIDVIAHSQAIECNGHTIAILGSGIEYCYPFENIDVYQNLCLNQLVMSEYPSNTKPKKVNFPRRNRIIAGLSKGVLVSQALKKSGTMITVGHALEQGKDIYCVPSRIDDMLGCNYLISQGARLVNDVFDIING